MSVRAGTFTVLLQFLHPLSFKIMQNEKQVEGLGVTAEVTVTAR